MWELDYEEIWAPKNWCFWTVALEKTLESPLDCKEIQPVHSEGDQSWDFFGRNDAKSWNSSTLATSWEELTHWKRLWCWEGLGAREGDDRGWDGWMASRTRWTWVWVNSGSWWWTGRPGVLRSMGSQRVGHDWVTELNWTSCEFKVCNTLIWYISALQYDCPYSFSEHLHSQNNGQFYFVVGIAGIQSLPEFDVYNLLLWSAVMALCATSPGPDYLLAVRTSFSSVHIRSSLQKIFLLFSPFLLCSTYVSNKMTVVTTVKHKCSIL